MEKLKLTRQQRLTAYCIMQYELSLKGINHTDGFCWISRKVFDLNDDYRDSGREFEGWVYNTEYFPEIEKRRPPNKPYGKMWFGPDDECVAERINLLQECIEELGNKLYNQNK